MDNLLNDETNKTYPTDRRRSLDADEEASGDWTSNKPSTTHRSRPVNATLDWVTWAEDDTDFWTWFWQWYVNFEASWTFDHEPGEVLTDPNYEWEWFQNHTAGAGEELVNIDTDDSE